MIFATAIPRASADEWISEQYECAMTIPTQESWAASLRQQLPAGEVIFHAVSMSSNQGIMLTYVPDMPSGDLKNPALVSRITELLASQGWNSADSAMMQWKNRPSVQFIAERRDAIAGKLIGISRATMRGRNLYVITAYGKGEADRASDPQFMRVMETFRFVEQPSVVIDHPVGPSAKTYRLALFAAVGAIALLLLALGAVLFRSRIRQQDSA